VTTGSPGAEPDPAERYVLAVDLGTGGPKVGLVSFTGEIAWHDHMRVPTSWLPGGGAVQDAALWWEIVRDRARAALASGAIEPAAVAAVSVTGQWASTVPVAEDGTPVGDCILWMDTRGGRYSREVIGGRVAGYAPRAALTWIRRSGGAPSAHGADPIGHMLHLLRGEPEVAAKARFFLEPVDYLTMRFSGVPAASHASMVAAWLTDNRRLTVDEYDPVLVRLSGVDASKLPPLRPTGSVIGTVRSDVAADLGLPGGVAVVTGTPDLHSAACGAGAIGEFEAHMAVSTSAWIGVPVPFKKTDPIRQIASVPGLTPGSYLVANNHETGGLCLEWLRDNVLFDHGAAPGGFGALTEAGASAPAGAGGVIFTPWLNGERSPVDDRRARGGFHNLSLSTGRGDLARAVLEGVAFNNRWLHDAVERFTKRRLDPVRMIGGGAESDLWCQIHADVMNRTIERVHKPLHANLRGAALFASLALDAVRPEDVRRLVEVDAFAPDPARRAVYDRLFAEFPRLYKAQRPMFARLNG
jgi:xylulokinase